jgi:hypothetical protein
MSNITKGFAFSIPPNEPHEWGILAFLVFWISGWNLGVSTFVFRSLANLIEKRTAKAAVQMLATLLIPHVFIGLVLPYFMGGIIFEAIGLWPYAYRLVKFLQHNGEAHRSTEVAADGGGGQDSERQEVSVLGNLARMHSEGLQSIKRTVSGSGSSRGRGKSDLTENNDLENNVVSTTGVGPTVVGGELGASATGGGLSKCDVCGAGVLGTDKFCGICGKPVVNVP